MRISLVGTTADRTSETRLLMEMLVEISKKHQVAILAVDAEGQPKAGIVPCKGEGAVESWIESLKPEILFTFHPELVVPNFNRIDVCIVLGRYRTQELEKYDLICAPYRDVKESLENKGFYCMKVPLQVNTKAFADLNLKRKYKFGMVNIDPVDLVNIDNECLILSNELESFNVMSWVNLLGKKVTVLIEENDNTLIKFYNSIEVCSVKRPDSYSTLHALACGSRVITSEYGEISSLSSEHIGKFPWLEFIENIEKHIGERDKCQKYQIFQ